MAKKIFKIDYSQLAELGLSLNEFLYCYLLQVHFPMFKFHRDLVNSNEVLYDGTTGQFTFVDDKLSNFINRLSSTTTTTTSSLKYYREIAERIIPLFPTGLKPDTNNPWRISVYACAERLMYLEDKTQERLNADEVVQATQLYINSFGSDLTTMRTLEYFIFKYDIKSGIREFKSDLLTYIERIRTNEPMNQSTHTDDWITKLR